MKEAAQIINEIKELEDHIKRLKVELLNLQSLCNHTYVSNPLMSTCSQCMKSEVHYY